MSIKSMVKGNQTLFDFVLRQIYKATVIKGHYFPKFSSKTQYKNVFGRKLDLKNPKTLNEKLMYYKLNLYWENELVAMGADKYAVRKFIEECGCSEILNPLLGVWKDACKIDWDSLPNKFALKCNHGSGYNIICKDKSTFDKEKATQLLNKWMQETYGYYTAEQGIYSKIDRRIIAEKYIDTEDGLPPADYKFFCSYGKVKLLFVACDRYEENTKFDYYYPDWTWIPVKNDHPNHGPIEKPEHLEKMIRYAEKLSERFPLVRVDFYDTKDSVIFGELTFTHFGCLHRFDPDEYDYKFGELFEDVCNANIIKG